MELSQYIISILIEETRMFKIFKIQISADYVNTSCILLYKLKIGNLIYDSICISVFHKSFLNWQMWAFQRLIFLSIKTRIFFREFINIFYLFQQMQIMAWWSLTKLIFWPWIFIDKNMPGKGTMVNYQSVTLRTVVVPRVRHVITRRQVTNWTRNIQHISSSSVPKLFSDRHLCIISLLM